MVFIKIILLHTAESILLALGLLILLLMAVSFAWIPTNLLLLVFEVTLL